MFQVTADIKYLDGALAGLTVPSGFRVSFEARERAAEVADWARRTMTTADFVRATGTGSRFVFVSPAEVSGEPSAPATQYAVHYTTREAFRDFIMGPDWVAEQRIVGLARPSEWIERTHRYVRTVEADGPESVYREMQGEVWSPNGEAREVIERAGVAHTSMCVGDVIVRVEDGATWMVDNVGFRRLGAKEA